MSWLTKSDWTQLSGSEEPPEPSFFEGSLTSIPRGLVQGGLRFGEMSAIVTASVLEAMGQTEGEEGSEAYWKRLEQRRKWRRQLGEGRDGSLSRIFSGVAEYGSMALVNIPSAATAIFGSEATSEIEKGKTLTEANALGTIRASSFYLGAQIPGALAPKYGLAPTLGYGAISNMGIGAAQRAAEKPFLPTEEEQAILDPEQLIIDGSLGALFGGLALRAQPKVVDAALDARALKKAQDAAPGVPTNMADMNAHMEALSDTMAAIDEGREPVYDGLKEVLPNMPEDPRVAARIDETNRAAHQELPEAKQISAPEGAEFGIELRFDDFSGHDLDSIEWMKKNGLVTDKEAPTLKSEVQNVPNRPELQAEQDLRTVSGGVPRESWIESTSIKGGDGKPATIYRGSSDGTTSSESFREESLGKATNHPSASLGVWFSADKVDAARYGKVGEYHLDLRNPKRYTIDTLPNFESAKSFAALRKKLKEQGFDGVMIDMRDVGGPVQFVAFDAESVINRKEAKPVETKAGKAEQKKPSLSEIIRSGEEVDIGGVKISPNMKIDGELTAKEVFESIASERAQFEEETIPKIKDLMQCFIGASGA